MMQEGAIIGLSFALTYIAQTLLTTITDAIN